MKGFGFMVVLLFVLAACGKEETAEATYKKIGAQEAKAMMDEGNVRIIDVREAFEFAEGHVPGAELLPVGDITGGQLDALGDKDEVLLVYCRSGNRSNTAAQYLVEQGYTQVYDFGGILDWPYEVER